MRLVWWNQWVFEVDSFPLMNFTYLKAFAWGLLFASSMASAELLTGTVTSVYDGDTITLHIEAGTKKIRLAGIDAPEIKQPYGIASREALRQDVLNKLVTVDTTKLDKYGRSVGKVLLDGEDINLKQVIRGLAWVYTDYIKELSAEDRELYLAAEKASSDDHIGLWWDDQPVAPWAYRKSK
jgi:endonuclease YncB( thermonuclease family)